ncbi:hypothetical protein [Nocardia pseudobrasiliensis]|uniref:DUF3311 domain-containing protein n=1 Tax=Nocardia pseudobrasiliensis TaxID=45979 RepID=A0A370I0G1_9NOCA|nr:hypothetical protein [Nocardia pseudobrasiliensis]RDI64229.1 hypothetical protein DFR76_10861 [Nocardia pseudobrasiliensis]
MLDKRGVLLLLPILPAVALVATPWLPFVDIDRLWFGLPAMLVWTTLWVLAIVPVLAALEWARGRDADEESGEESS